MDSNNSIAILIPTRGIKSSMTRLRQEISDDVVDLIVKTLFLKTLKFASSTDLPIIIACPDEKLKEIIIKYHPKDQIVIHQDDGESINKALEGATLQFKYDYYLLVMPDLPGLSIKHVGTMLKMNNLFENVIAPTTDDGTAMALLQRDFYSKNFFGQNSANKIVEYGKLIATEIGKYIGHEILKDLDTTSDFNFWTQNGFKVNP